LGAVLDHADFATIGVNLVTRFEAVNAACDHERVMKSVAQTSIKQAY
jgi:hypothetical protein